MAMRKSIPQSTLRVASQRSYRGHRAATSLPATVWVGGEQTSSKDVSGMGHSVGTPFTNFHRKVKATTENEKITHLRLSSTSVLKQ